MPMKEWGWKFATLAILYPIIYYVIGYYVTWRNPEAQAFYGGTDPGNFFAQMLHVIRTTPGVFLLQPMRALLWTAITLPVIRMLKGGTLETSLTLGFLFASLMGFLYSGMVFLLSPLAATSYLQLGLSASGHLPLDNGVDLFIEGGMGMMTSWHPRTQYVRMAFGPVFGLGLAVRRISFGLHGMWSPPVMQSTPSGAPDVFAASLSLRYAY